MCNVEAFARERKNVGLVKAKSLDPKMSGKHATHYHNRKHVTYQITNRTILTLDNWTKQSSRRANHAKSQKSSTVTTQARHLLGAALAQTTCTVLAMTRIRGNIPSFSGSPSAPSTTTDAPPVHAHQHHSTLLSRGLISPTKPAHDPCSRKRQRAPGGAKRKPPPVYNNNNMASSSSSTPLL